MMTTDDMLKLKAVTLYILKQCGELDFIHLFKILYFAERQHYATYREASGEGYVLCVGAWSCSFFLYDAVKVATNSAHAVKGSLLQQLADSLKPGNAECYYFIGAAEEPDMDELSKADLACLDASIKENLQKDAKQLSKDSHDVAWQTAWDARSASPMNPLLMAQAGGATSGFVEYLKEQSEIDDYLQGR